MKKNFIAMVCCFGVSLPAFSQSSIQIYGYADANLQYGKLRGDDVMGVGEGGWQGSRIGFRGEEDLGNGLKAVFVLEEGIDIGTGKSFYMAGVDSQENAGSDIFTRQAYVGLKGSFGQVGLGRQYSPGFYTVVYDPGYGFSWSPVLELLNFTGLTHLNSGFARWNNSVSYTGTFQTLTLRGIYSAGNRETDNGKAVPANHYSRSDDDKYGIGADFSYGHFSAGAAYTAMKFKYKLAPDDATHKEWTVGMSYNFGLASLVGTYKKGTDVQGHNGLDVDLWSVGFVAPFGSSKLYAGYTQGKIDADYAANSYNPKAFSVSYTYSFSKRTIGYVGYTNTDYDDMQWGDIARFKLSVPGGLNGHAPGDKIDRTNLFTVGLNHQF